MPLLTRVVITIQILLIGAALALTVMYFHGPALWLFSGGAFFDTIGYVYPRDAAGGDGFNSNILRCLIIGGLSAAIAIFVFTFLIFMRRWTPADYIKRIKVMALSLTIIPTATFLTCLIAVLRLIIDMGVTTRRLLGIGFFSICLLFTIAGFYLLLRKKTQNA